MNFKSFFSPIAGAFRAAALALSKADGKPGLTAEDFGVIMGKVADIVAAIGTSRFSLVDHFTLPDEAWWDDFYTPMERRIEELRGRYAGDAEALGVLDQLAKEPKLHQRYSDYYAYEFFVARRG